MQKEYVFKRIIAISREGNKFNVDFGDISFSTSTDTKAGKLLSKIVIKNDYEPVVLFAFFILTRSHLSLNRVKIVKIDKQTGKHKDFIFEVTELPSMIMKFIWKTVLKDCK